MLETKKTERCLILQRAQINCVFADNALILFLYCNVSYVEKLSVCKNGKTVNISLDQFEHEVETQQETSNLPVTVCSTYRGG